MKFDPPSCDAGNRHLHFMLFPGTGDNGGGRNNRRRHRVLVTDLTGRALLYDPESPTVRSLHNLTAAKHSPVSLAGNSNNCVYVLDTCLTRPPYATLLHDHHLRSHRLDAFVRDAGGLVDDWRCISLPPPPYAAAGDAHVASYATVNGDTAIWASSSTWSGGAGLDGGGAATYSFDTASQAWAKVGDWALPFSGRAHHVPEHGVWVGVSPSSSGYSGVDDPGDASAVVVCDLAAAAATAEAPPPRCVAVWSDVTSPQWANMSAWLVHLGRSRFCHVRFFELERPYVDRRSYAVFTGIDVGGGGGTEVVQHRSVQYRVLEQGQQWVL